MGAPPHPIPLPCLRRSGFAQVGQRGEGRVRGPHIKELNAFVLVAPPCRKNLVLIKLVRSVNANLI